MSDYIGKLIHAIRHSFGCSAVHIKTVPVKVVFEGKTAWEGEVEVFDLTGHPKTNVCFAWGYPDEKRKGELEIVTVLRLPPITTPQEAVQISIAHASKG